ncbi:RasGEF domain protein [Necator americanus]|uniref:RasGEF domain protein n=1 Tax=Necator americanus TaxID=51031 RepID=W2T5N0_NECAM|nr:RasGEF domain protein [Necator americanus]ETN77213.1 RasGEF domain protein [Necator americanus]
MLAASPLMASSTKRRDLELNTRKSDKFDQNDIVVDAMGNVLSGSSEALIARLLPTRDGVPDANYMFTLLLNLRTVMSPEELMQKIVQQCMFTQNADAVNFCREGRDRMFSHLLRLCREWVTSIPHDFRSEHMRTRLNELLGLCSVDRNFKQKAADLQSTLKSTINRLERYDKAVKNLQKTLSENTQRPMQSDILVGLITVCPDPKIVAQQLTHIEMERFSMVGVDEILVALASNDLADLGRNRNGPGGSISFYVEWFNRLSSFAATEVLRQLKKKHRVEVIEYLIDVAKECCEIGNFNSLMAIVAGLSLPAVSRMKRTPIKFQDNLNEFQWSRVEKSKLEILQHQLDPSGNFLSYRATMKAAQWRAETAGSNQRIVIPFFVLLLKDLFLIYHGSVRTLPNGHLNFVRMKELSTMPGYYKLLDLLPVFEKAYSQIAEQLRSVVRWKGILCSFPKNAAVLQYTLVCTLYGERESMLASFECEPAESAAEREQLKKLKVRQ